MPKPMKYRDVAKRLRAQGCTSAQGKGDHEKWRNGTTWTIITQTTECSPKVVKDALDAIERSKQQ
mgnify:CR=1 FL=1